MKKRFQKAVDEVLADFDFEKVHETMVKLDWRWHRLGEADLSVPSLNEVQEMGKKLLQETAESAAMSKGEYVIGTGGFRAEAKYYKKKEGLREKSFLWVRLAFILEEWDNCE